MQTLADDLRRALDEALPRLRSISEEDSALHPAPGKWSPREVIGHLIDSASHNQLRFVEAQLSEGLAFPGYAQSEWVALQKYGEARWSDLLELWRQLNLHIARIMEGVADEVAGRPRANQPCRGRMAAASSRPARHARLVHE